MAGSWRVGGADAWRDQRADDDQDVTDPEESGTSGKTALEVK